MSKAAASAAFQRLDRRRSEALGAQRDMVDAWCRFQRAVADGVADDVLDLRLLVAQRLQGQRHHAVDDLEIAAAGERLELDQGEIRLDAGGIAIHHQADRAGGRDHGRLRIAIAMALAQAQRLVPGALAPPRPRLPPGSARASSATGRTLKPS